MRVFEYLMQNPDDKEILMVDSWEGCDHLISAIEFFESEKSKAEQAFRGAEQQQETPSTNENAPGKVYITSDQQDPDATEGEPYWDDKYLLDFQAANNQFNGIINPNRVRTRGLSGAHEKKNAEYTPPSGSSTIYPIEKDGHQGDSSPSWLFQSLAAAKDDTTETILSKDREKFLQGRSYVSIYHCLASNNIAIINRKRF